MLGVKKYPRPGLPLTPGPAQVPPAGVATRAWGVVVAAHSAGKGVRLITGVGTTVSVSVLVAVHVAVERTLLVASEYERVLTPASAAVGVKT
jgi:hypothetical protein